MISAAYRNIQLPSDLLSAPAPKPIHAVVTPGPISCDIHTPHLYVVSKPRILTYSSDASPAAVLKRYCDISSIYLRFAISLLAMTPFLYTAPCFRSVVLLNMTCTCHCTFIYCVPVSFARTSIPFFSLIKVFLRETVMQDHHHIEVLLPVEFPLVCTSFIRFGLLPSLLKDFSALCFKPLLFCNYKLAHRFHIVNTLFTYFLKIRYSMYLYLLYLNIL